MALARKCDRCGKLYEQYNNIEIEDMIVNGIYTTERTERNLISRRHFDLCEECCWELLIWLQSTITTVKMKNNIEQTEPILSAEEPG